MRVEICPQGVIKVNEMSLSPFLWDGERFYSLSELKNATGIDLNTIIRKKGFLGKVSALTHKELRRTPNVVRSLKKAGLYKACGRREDVRTYCVESVFYLILCEMSETFSMDVLRNYINSFQSL